MNDAQKAAHRIASKKCYEKYKERDKDKRRVAKVKWIEDNPELYLYDCAKTRRHKMPFSITPEDIKIPTHCPYLDIQLTNIRGKGRNINSNISIDRIDSSKGYIKGNIQVISFLANKMKQDASKEQLISFAKGVLKIYKEYDEYRTP